jgi:hypothetical protein
LHIRVEIKRNKKQERNKKEEDERHFGGSSSLNEESNGCVRPRGSSNTKEILWRISLAPAKRGGRRRRQVQSCASRGSQPLEKKKKEKIQSPEPTHALTMATHWQIGSGNSNNNNNTKKKKKKKKRRKRLITHTQELLRTAN